MSSKTVVVLAAAAVVSVALTHMWWKRKRSAMRANVLVIGGGGREHTLAWKLSQSKKVGKVFVCPGNGGTEDTNRHISNVPCDISNHAAVVALCKRLNVQLVVVGPEQPLADGLVDSLVAAGVPTFGPTKKAAQIEASKAFSKEFMTRHKIPTARFANFTDYSKAIKYVDEVGHDVVIKASGLAAGKGVMMTYTKEEARKAVKEIMIDKIFGEAGREIVIEEMMEGPEASILSLSDGKTVVCMAAAQDHKRIHNGDKGANTGGMGAYCPAPIVTPLLAREIEEKIAIPCIQGMRQEGAPFVGCLFIGVMLTKDGPRCLEFNARFGDPETEVVLPLIDDEKGDDLFTILYACTNSSLSLVTITMKPMSAATVVMAAAGYPAAYEKGVVIEGTDAVKAAIVFHAGTTRVGDALVTNGGRVLTVTGIADTLKQAVDAAYAGVKQISFAGAQYRTDIAHRALANTHTEPLRIGVLGSTNGTDMEAIVAAIKSGELNARIVVVVSNVENAGILNKARTHKLTGVWIGSKGWTREEFDRVLTKVLQTHGVEIVCLIGFMRILSPLFITEWRHKVLNVHPSLLPAFAGGMDTNVHQSVLNAKVPETGCTIHWVDETVDGGEIVLQKKCQVVAGETVDTLKAKVQELEGQAFVEVLKKIQSKTL